MQHIRRLVLQRAAQHQHFLRYGAIGISGVLLDFIVFVLLFNVFHLDPIVANVISTSCGIINNFLLNRQFNFKRKDYLLLRFLSFYAAGLAGLLLSTIILRVFHDYMGINANIVKLVSVVVVVILQYGLNKHISFRDIPPHHGDSLSLIGRFLRRTWPEAASLLVAAAVFAAYVPKYVLGTDESDNFLSAKLILHGQLPYADFFSHHMPGAYVMSAIWYVLADGNPLGFRIVYTAALFTWLIANFLIIRRYASRRSAIAYVLLVGLAHGLLLQYMALAESYVFFALTTVVTVLIFVPATKLAKRHWLAAVGLLLFMIPWMAVAYIYVTAILYLLWAYRLKDHRRIIPLAAGIAIAPYLVFAAALVLTGSLHRFLFDNLTFNARYYAPFFAGGSSGPVSAAVHMVHTTLTQIWHIISHPFSHVVPLCLLAAFLMLPAALWLRGRKVVAVAVAAILLFADARVGLYGPPGIEQTFAESITQHAAIYRGLALVCFSLSLTLLPAFRRRTFQWQTATAAALALVLITNFVLTNRTYFSYGKGFGASLAAAEALPDPSIGVINAATAPGDSVWVGPADFLGQSYLHAQRATDFTFFLPWHQVCPDCHRDFYGQLAARPPLVIAWDSQNASSYSGRPAPGYEQDMHRFLQAYYLQIHPERPAFHNVYFLRSQQQLIE